MDLNSGLKKLLLGCHLWDYELRIFNLECEMRENTKCGSSCNFIISKCMAEVCDLEDDTGVNLSS